MTQTNEKQQKSGKSKPSLASVVLLVALLCALGFFIWQNAALEPVASLESPPITDTPVTQPPETGIPSDETPEVTDSPTLPEFTPQAISSTLPSNLIAATNIMMNGQLVDSLSLPDPIDFGLGEDYTNVQGIVTFRGNNFRDNASYGTANIVNKQFSDNKWNVSTGALTAPDGETWTGSGWVGQPLMMTWPKEVRAHMNMHDWAKQADTLTEVIYATMDGNVYFMDLETGSKTRPDLTLGYTFKGSGALDPRGYPILYLGSGYNSTRGTSHAFIINLLDCSIMYEFGAADSFSLRGNLSFFDGSALVDAETDRLIYPGESGIMYIMKLNTNYDPAAGTLSVAPSDIIKWRYKGNSRSGWYLGMEDSAVIWRGHIIMSTNDGYLFCVNLNTLETVWVQDVLDDTNCSPVLELEDGHPYVYISTSFHAGWRAPATGTATIPIWKIDAVTGEIVWKTDYQCYTNPGTSGGVQGTLAMGKNDLSDLIFVPLAKTPNMSSGVLSAINKHTGEIVWEKQTQMYLWSSPVAVYDQNGKGYIVMCTTGGYMHLFDGLTGEPLDEVNLGSNIEASPAIYNGNIVVGTRASGIFGIKLT